MEIFRKYLELTLSSKGIEDVYSDYFITMLEENCSSEALKEWLDGITNMSSDETSAMATEIHSRFLGKDSYVEEIPSVISRELPLSCCDVVALESAITSVCSSGIGDRPVAEEKPNDISLWSQDMDINRLIDEQVDVEDEDVYLDWPELLFSLEESLVRACPSVLFSQAVMYAALVLFEGHVASACRLILASHEASLSCRPCRHMTQGGCFRSDCPFEHDTSQVPCRYWLLAVGCATDTPSEGQSKEGSYSSSCTFLHGFPDILVSSVLDSDSLPAANPVPVISFEDDSAFPSLPQQNNAKTKIKKSAGSDAPPSLPSAQSLLNFQYRPPGYVGGGATSDRAKSKGKDADNRGSRRESKGGVGVTSEGRGALSDYSSSSSSPSSSSSLIDWVQTGTSVASDYAQARAAASAMARARNTLLDEATRAFVGGNKQLARSLSHQGQAMNAEMKRLHKLAAKDIFSRRNSLTSLEGGQIDLHGLHGSECEEVLCDLVPTLLARKGGSGSGSRRLSIVTGSGHHSVGVANKGETARLLTRAKAVLQELGLKYTEVKDPNGYVGGLHVHAK